MLGIEDQNRIQRWAMAVVILAEVEQAVVHKKPDKSLGVRVLQWKTALYERTVNRTERDAAETDAARIAGLREDNLDRFERAVDSNLKKPKGSDASGNVRNSVETCDSRATHFTLLSFHWQPSISSDQPTPTP